MWFMTNYGNDVRVLQSSFLFAFALSLRFNRSEANFVQNTMNGIQAVQARMGCPAVTQQGGRRDGYGWDNPMWWSENLSWWRMVSYGSIAAPPPGSDTEGLTGGEGESVTSTITPCVGDCEGPEG